MTAIRFLPWLIFMLLMAPSLAIATDKMNCSDSMISVTETALGLSHKVDLAGPLMSQSGLRQDARGQITESPSMIRSGLRTCEALSVHVGSINNGRPLGGTQSVARYRYIHSDQG